MLDHPADIPDTAHETPEEPPLDRLIRLIAESNLIRELPQTSDVPLLQKASVIAALYQAKALQEISGTLHGIRQSCEMLEQWFGDSLIPAGEHDEKALRIVRTASYVERPK